MGRMTLELLPTSSLDLSFPLCTLHELGDDGGGEERRDRLNHNLPVSSPWLIRPSAARPRPCEMLSRESGPSRPGARPPLWRIAWPNAGTLGAPHALRQACRAWDGQLGGVTVSTPRSQLQCPLPVPSSPLRQTTANAHPAAHSKCRALLRAPHPPPSHFQGCCCIRAFWRVASRIADPSRAAAGSPVARARHPPLSNAGIAQA